MFVVKVSHPSGSWRKFFMVLTCWKWQDMSVAKTISTTSALSSLKTQAHKTTALNLLSGENNCSASKCEDNSFFLNEKLIVSVCLAVKLHQTFLSLLCLVENSTARMVKHFFQYFLQGVSRTLPLKNITPLHSYFFIFVIFLNWKDSLLHLKHPIKHPIKYFKTF